MVQPETTRVQSRHITVRQMVTPAVFLISIATETFFPQAFLGPFTLLAIPLALFLADRSFPQAEPGMRTGEFKWSEFLWRAGTFLPWALVIALAAWAMSS